LSVCGSHMIRLPIMDPNRTHENSNLNRKMYVEL
jgi:hypothetical protein